MYQLGQFGCAKVREIDDASRAQEIGETKELDISGCKSLETIPKLFGARRYQNYDNKPFYLSPRMIEFG